MYCHRNLEGGLLTLFCKVGEITWLSNPKIHSPCLVPSLLVPQALRKTPGEGAHVFNRTSLGTQDALTSCQAPHGDVTLPCRALES